MPYGIKHLPDLTVPPLMQGDLVPRIRSGFERPDVTGSRPDALHPDASPEPVQLFFRRGRGHLDAIHFRNPAAAGHEASELAVIGQDQEPLGRKVEAADRVNPLTHAATQQVDNGSPLLWVAQRGDHVAGLVDQDVNGQSRRWNLSAVDGNHVPVRVGTHSHVLDDLSVKRHPSLLDHLLRLAARRDAGVCKNLL